MTKLTYRLALIWFITLLIATLALPALSLAVNQGADAQLCAHLDGIGQKITKNFNAQQAKLNAQQKAREKAIDTTIKFKEKKLELAYSDEKTATTTYLNELEQKAKTSDQRTTISVFKTKLAAAMDKKRQAQVKAMNDFKTNLQQLLTKRDGDVAQFVNHFKDAPGKAVSQAKVDCLSSRDVAAIENDLKQALYDARQTYIKESAVLSPYQDTLKALRATFKDALQKIADDFKNSMQESRDTLVKAFATS